MPKDRQAARAAPYFQMPLCILTMPLAERDLVQHLVSYVAIEKGRVLLSKIPGWAKRSLPESEDEDDIWGGADEDETLTDLIGFRASTGVTMLDEVVRSLANKGKLPGGFRHHDPDHLGVALVARTGGFQGGHMLTMEKQHRLLAQHVAAFEKQAGKDAEVRIRADLLWKLVNGELGIRELRVLAGAYSKIGSAAYKRLTYEDWRYRAAGYKSAAAYEAIHGKGGEDRAQPEPGPAGPDGLAGYRLDARSLPRGFRHGWNGSAYHSGYFRYDAAFWFALVDKGCAPFDLVCAGVEPVLTIDGGLYRWPNHTADNPHHTSLTTARTAHGAGAPFPIGMLVFWRARDKRRSSVLRVGRVVAFEDRQNVLTVDSGGEHFKLTPGSSPAPVATFREALANLPAATGAEESEQVFTADLLTPDQLRKTRADLERIRLLHSFSMGRTAWYSNRMTGAEIRDRVAIGKAHKLAQAQAGATLRAGFADDVEKHRSRIAASLNAR